MDEEQEECQNWNIKKCEQCDEMIDVNHKQEHFDENHKKVKCDQCGTELEVKKMEGHPSVCPNRKQMCSYCNLEVMVRELATHTSHCGSRTRECQFCNRIIKLRELDAHEAGCLEEQRREKDRRDAERANKFKIEEARRKEEMQRMEEMARLELLRKEQDRKRVAEDKIRQEEGDRRARLKRDEDAKRKETELRTKELSRPAPTTSYQNAYEGVRKAVPTGPNPYAMPQTGTGAQKTASQPSRDYKPTGYDNYLREQPKPTVSRQPDFPDSRGYKPTTSSGTGSSKPGISRPAPTGPSYRPPSSQQTGYGTSLGGAGRAVLNDPEEESRRIAKQLQEQFDNEANEDLLSREQLKNKAKSSKYTQKDEQIARELQEQLDLELARNFAENGSPERQPPAYVDSRAGGQGSNYADPRGRAPRDFGGVFDDDFGGLAPGIRPDPRAGQNYPASNYQQPRYGQPKPPTHAQFGYNGPSNTNQSPDFEDDEEYQRVIYESMKDNRVDTKKRY